MKKVLLTFVACLPFVFLNAQNCMPDTSFMDSTGVFPPPFDADIAPNGGINDCAIIGEEFNFPFTIGVGDSITVPFGGASVTFALDNIVVNDVSGLPEGIAYLCEPNDCIYENSTVGCVALKGIPTATNAAGAYDLEINVTINFIGFPFTLPFTFPNPDIAPGKYTIHLLNDASEPCDVVATNEQLTDHVQLTLQPNPSAGPVNIKINSDVTGEFNFHVVDLLGQSVHREAVRINQGLNSLSYDGSHLSNGLYFIVLENKLGRIAQKMTIQQ